LQHVPYRGSTAAPTARAHLPVRGQAHHHGSAAPRRQGARDRRHRGAALPHPAGGVWRRRSTLARSSPPGRASSPFAKVRRRRAGITRTIGVTLA